MERFYRSEPPIERQSGGGGPPELKRPASSTPFAQFHNASMLQPFRDELGELASPDGVSRTGSAKFICPSALRLDRLIVVPNAVGVAQLVERWIVVPVVVGSNPTTHPSKNDSPVCSLRSINPVASTTIGSASARFNDAGSALPKVSASIWPSEQPELLRRNRIVRSQTR
jgi:hypothetical protein